jgi:glycogen debranching enzyme
LLLPPFAHASAQGFLSDTTAQKEEASLLTSAATNSKNKSMATPPLSSREWLEADGSGGFASGTATGIRTRRYHALLLTATTPPTRRMVLVNGFDAWIETPKGRFALTSQCYTPDVIHPDGAQRIEDSSAEPGPKWQFKFEDGTELTQEILVAGEAGVTALTWRLTREANVGEALRLDHVVLAGREEARTSVRFTAPKTGTSRIPITAQPKRIEAPSRPRATRPRTAVTV